MINRRHGHGHSVADLRAARLLRLPAALTSSAFVLQIYQNLTVTEKPQETYI